MNNVIDYRNAKYQGMLDYQGLRQQIGILIDDDLSFYISEWQNGKINGLSIVYIAHGKYIYGHWKNNQAHGLNVFRSGDTVLLGQFEKGYPCGRILVIFERYNLIAVLQSCINGQYSVIQRGQLRRHETLLKYIELLNLKVPEYYFSLTKFASYLTTQNIRLSPCNLGNCYFGFNQGLGIIFNSSNGVVSVGYHQDKEVIEYGGIFQSKLQIQEGNFETGQIITYNKKRPIQKLYTIFQKMHKKSLNFKNQYFDSKIKTLHGVEDILRQKIKDIVNMKKRVDNIKVTQCDLNDSLDYHEFMQQSQAERLRQIRQDVYERVKLGIKKTTSKYIDQSTPKIAKNTPKNKQNSINLNKQNINTSYRKNLSREKSRAKIRIQQQSIKAIQSLQIDESNSNKSQLKMCQISFQGLVASKVKKLSKENTKYFKNELEQEYKKNSHQVSYKHSKNRQFQQNELESFRVPTFKGLIEQQLVDQDQVYNVIHKELPIIERKNSKKLITTPNYEDLQQRRQRLIKSYNPKQLEKVSSKIEINQIAYESPCIRQNLLNKNQKQQIFSPSQKLLPLSLNYQEERNKSPKLSENVSKIVCGEHKPQFKKKQSHNYHIQKQYKRAQQSNQTFNSPSVKKNPLKVSNFDQRYTSPNSLCRNTLQTCNSSIKATPTRRKIYTYYFDK